MRISCVSYRHAQHEIHVLNHINYKSTHMYIASPWNCKGKSTAMKKNTSIPIPIVEQFLLFYVYFSDILSIQYRSKLD